MRETIAVTSSFVDQFNFVDPHRLKDEPNLELDTTAYWMRQRFGVSPLFFSCFRSPKYVVKIGNASLIRTEAGKRVALGEGYCDIPYIKHLNSLNFRWYLSVFFRTWDSCCPHLVLAQPNGRPTIHLHYPRLP